MVSREEASRAGRLSLTARIFGVACDPSDHVGLNTRHREEAIDYIVQETNAGRGEIVYPDNPKGGLLRRIFNAVDI